MLRAHLFCAICAPGVMAVLAADAAPSAGGCAATGFLNQTVAVEEGNPKYVLYVPEAYTPDNAWPLIVFLHGAGERGDDGMKQSQVGLGAAIRMNPERFPALVIMPQCPEDRYWDAQILKGVEQAMAQTRQQYNVDEKRIYLTGLSMGGYATWMWGALKADTFAALMPICGGGDIEDLKGLAKKSKSGSFGTLQERVNKLAQVPIFAFHGANDEVVPPERSRQMVKLVEAANGEVKYKEFPDTGHNSWDQAYGSANAIKWLFKQKKKP